MNVNEKNIWDSEALSIIAKCLQVQEQDIENIQLLKKGMTNHSFIFAVADKKYIMRIPGEGTDQLINRREEAEVYAAILGRGLCDDPVYLNPENGYKITAFLEDVRSCDPDNVSDLQRCMQKLKEFHAMKLQVKHEFKIFEQIEFYEQLWQGNKSIYEDYLTTKAKVLSMQPFIEKHAEAKVLTHIDAVPDNFLFYNHDQGLQLTDWEYAGMQDPHVDIAMFSIYALYNKNQIDRLIDIYFESACPELTRIKIYCYVAACGLLWSNWCEFKSQLGVEFGEYSLKQYSFAQEYYHYAKAELEKLGMDFEHV